MVKGGDSYYGLLQAFADLLKLLIKEYVAPTQANIILFFLGPVITVIFALLGYAVIPYGPGLTISVFQFRYILYVSYVFFSYIWYIISRMKC
jgi:NADH dehydrogenase subunit H (EC 1.6.5.3)